METISREIAREKGLRFFHTGKHCRLGHLSQRYVSTGICVECSKTRDRPQTEAQAAQARERARLWRENNIERARNSSREYHRAVREQRKPYMQNYAKENRDRLRDQLNERRTDPKRRLAHSIAGLIRWSFVNNGYTKRAKTYNILGCTFEEFKQHIERQFLQGMSWDNRSEWHIDHITPVSSAKTIEEVEQLNHHTNMRPIWATDNRAKSDKILFLI